MLDDTERGNKYDSPVGNKLFTYNNSKIDCDKL